MASAFDDYLLESINRSAGLTDQAPTAVGFRKNLLDRINADAGIKPIAPVEKPSVGAEFMKGVRQIPASTGYAVGEARRFIGSAFGDEEMAAAGKAQVERNSAAMAAEPGAIQDLSQASGPMDVVRYIANQAPAQAPQLGASIGGGLIGAGIGGALGSVVPVLGTAAGAWAGGLLGAAVPSFILQASDIFQNLVEAGVDEQRALTYSELAGIPMTLLDVALPGAKVAAPLARKIIGAKLKQEVAERAAPALARRIGRGALEGFGIESSTEATQQAIQEATQDYATGKPFFTKQTLANVAGAGLIGGALGLPAGAVGGAFEPGEGGQPGGQPEKTATPPALTPGAPPGGGPAAPGPGTSGETPGPLSPSGETGPDNQIPVEAKTPQESVDKLPQAGEFIVAKIGRRTNQGTVEAVTQVADEQDPSAPATTNIRVKWDNGRIYDGPLAGLKDVKITPAAPAAVTSPGGRVGLNPDLLRYAAEDAKGITPHRTVGEGEPDIAPDHMRLYRGEGDETGAPFDPTSSFTGQYFTDVRSHAEHFARKSPNGKVYYVDIPNANLRGTIIDANEPSLSFILPKKVAATKQELKPISQPIEKPTVSVEQIVPTPTQAEPAMAKPGITAPVIEGGGKPVGEVPEPIEKPTVQIGTGTKADPVEVQTPADLEEAGKIAAEHPESQIPEPTDAQKDAGNYQKVHAKFPEWGLSVAIENPKGTVRKSRSDAKVPWEVVMPAHYGYIKRTEGADSTEAKRQGVDIFIGDDLESQKFYVIDQKNLETGAYDEAKVMAAFPDKLAAQTAYIQSFSDGKGADRIMGIKPMSLDELKAWLPTAKRAGPVSSAEDIVAGETPVKETIAEGASPAAQEAPGETPAPPEQLPTPEAEAPQAAAAEVVPRPKLFEDPKEEHFWLVEELGHGSALADSEPGRWAVAQGYATQPEGSKYLMILPAGRRRAMEAAKEAKKAPAEETAPTAPEAEEGAKPTETSVSTAETVEKPSEEVEKPSEPTAEEAAATAEDAKLTPEEREKRRKERLTDAGEAMEGRRKQAEKDLDKDRSLQKILAAIAKPKLWPVLQPDGATSGTDVLLTWVRNRLDAFGEWAGTSMAHGGLRKWQTKPLDALQKLYDRDAAKVVVAAAEYKALIEQLRAGTEDAMTVAQAQHSILSMLYTDPAVTTYSGLSDIGKSFAKFSRRHLQPQDFDWVRDDATLEEKKQMRRISSTAQRSADLPDYRNGKDVTGEDLIATFGFRGVEFGNWTTGVERQLFVNNAYDALHDLAAALKIPPKAISLGGKLGLAFGSRGYGRHAAHYEPDNKVINITKTRTDGSLAHEWGHALDYLTQEATGKSAKEIVALKTWLKKRYDQDALVKLVERLLTGGTWVRGAKREGPIEQVKRMIASEFWRQDNWGVVKSTAYYEAAKKVGDASYWANDEELWARAFEGWVFDQLPGDPFLVNQWVMEGFASEANGYGGTPYPMAPERTMIAGMYRELFDHIAWDENGTPSFKETFTSPVKREEDRIREWLKSLDLEAYKKRLETGVESVDGLFWYRLPSGKTRGVGNHPPGFRGYIEGTYTWLGYPGPLSVDEMTDYKMAPVTFKDDDAFKAIVGKPIYIQGETDDTVGQPGEEPTAEVPPEAGGAPGIGGDTGPGGGAAGPERPSPDDGAGEGGGEPGNGPPGGDAGVSDTAVGGGSSSAASGPDATPAALNYRITDADGVGVGTITQKFDANVAAIETLLKIESEGRLATPEEQAILVKYVGWGGMPQAFQDYHYGTEATVWSKRAARIKELLSEREHEAAKLSTVNAHYTSMGVIDVMWQALAQFGFRTGRVLEPAVGVGGFFGRMPETMLKGSKLFGVDMDSLSARIARQLYQGAAIIESPYQDAKFGEGYFDVAISNVPFADVRVFDETYARNREYLLHDYFFVKSLKLVRPGGIVAFITSKGTLDKLDTKTRAKLAEDADFLGAIRMPQDAFKDNANTVVTTDMIFLRRKVPGVEAPPQTGNWLTTAAVDLPIYQGYSAETTKQTINDWIDKNRDMIVGQLMARRGRYGEGLEVAAISDTKDLPGELAARMHKLPGKVMIERSTVDEQVRIANAVAFSGDAKEGSFYIEGDKILRREGALGIPVEISDKKNQLNYRPRLLGLMGVQKAGKEVLQAQLEGKDEKEIGPLRKALGKLYDAFVKEHDYLTPAIEKSIFADDPESSFVFGLEIWDDETHVGKKADIFTKNTTPKVEMPTKAETASDALAFSMNYRGKLDLAYMAGLTGMSHETLLNDLGSSVFDDPERGWVPADEYLSGNVKNKLAIARNIAKGDKRYQRNVDALEKVIPADIPRHQIKVLVGTAWVPASDYGDFAASLARASRDSFDIHYAPQTGTYTINWKGTSQRERKDNQRRATMRAEAIEAYGTRRMDFFRILEKMLNNKPIIVHDRVPGGPAVVNQQETDHAKAKAELVQARLEKWVWNEEKRATRLHRRYNDLFNNSILRDYDGSHLTFPGMTPLVTLNPHQKNAAWRVLQGNTYLGHEVGTGKTFIALAAAMKGKQLGLVRKPMVAVLNSTLGQFAAEVRRLYPASRVLVQEISTKADERRKQLARIANNDWDLVIVSHDAFNRIGMSPQAIEAYFQEEIDALEDARLAAAEELGEKAPAVKELAKAKLRLIEKMKELVARYNKDKALAFEELGIDNLFVDEAQEYKNVPIATRMGRNVRGLGDTKGSGRAMHLLTVTKWLNDRQGRGIVLMSGTPISNTIAELYGLSKYLQPQVMRDRGLMHFDRWANAFAEIGNVAQYLPEGGGYKMVTRIRRLYNLPDLLGMVYGVLDVMTAEKAGLKRPKIKGGQARAIIVPQNEFVSHYMKNVIRPRAQFIRESPREAQEEGEYMFVLINDARKVAIDLRLIEADSDDHPNTKTNWAVKEIKDIWTATKKVKGTQLVFLDFGIHPGKPKPKAPVEEGGKKKVEIDATQGTTETGFSVYQDLIAKLVAAGIPKSEIAYVHQAKNDKERQALFKKVRDGDIRVFIGSTEKAGTGVNVQDRVAAIHHLDIYWNLASYTQRNGRGIRQGNQIEELMPEWGGLEILNYATAETTDGFMWDTIKLKAGIVDQVMSKSLAAREIDDISKETLEAGEMVALIDGNPLIKEMITLENDLRQLRSRYAAHEEEKESARRRLAGADYARADHLKNIKNFEESKAALAERAVISLGTDDIALLKKAFEEDRAERAKKETDEKKKAAILEEPDDRWTTFGKAKEIGFLIDKEHGTEINALAGERAKDKDGRHWFLLKEDGTGAGYQVYLHPHLFTKQPAAEIDTPHLNLSFNPGTPRKMGTILKSSAERIDQLIAENRERIANLDRDMKVWQETVAAEFPQLAEYEQKSTREAEVKRLLTSQTEDHHVVADDGEAATAPIFYRKTKDGAEVVEGATLYHSESYPGRDFYIGKALNGGWAMSDAPTGVIVKRGTTKAEAISNFEDLVRDDSQRLTDALARHPDLTSAAKEAAYARWTNNEEEEGEATLVSGTTAAAQAYITSDQMMEDLAAAAKAINPSVNVEFVGRIFVGAAETAKHGLESERMEASGLYEPAKNLITLALLPQGEIRSPYTVLFHEVWHSLEKLLTPAERAILQAELPERNGIAHTERAADAYTAWQSSAGGDLKPVIKRIFAKIRDFFRRLANLLRGRGFEKVEDIFARAPQIGRRPMLRSETVRARTGQEAFALDLQAEGIDPDAAATLAGADLKRITRELFRGVQPVEGVVVERPITANDMPVLAKKLLPVEAAFRRWLPSFIPTFRRVQELNIDQYRWIDRYRAEAKGAIGKLNDEQRLEIGNILFAADVQAREFTDEDLRRGYYEDPYYREPVPIFDDNRVITDEAVLKAYRAVHEIIGKIGRQIDQHERGMLGNYRARKTSLINRMARERQMEDPAFQAIVADLLDLLSQYRRADYATGTGENPATLAAAIDEGERELFGRFMDAEGEISRTGRRFADAWEELKSIEQKLQATSVRRRKGYYPHKFFGSWGLYEITEEPQLDADGNQIVLPTGEPATKEVRKLVADPKNGFYTDSDAATRAANAYAETHEGAQLVVRPVAFRFPNFQATELSDASFFRFLSNVSDEFEVGFTEAREMVQGVARRRFRRRIAGFKQKRQGIAGYSRDFVSVLNAHIGESMRYITMDEAKYRVISFIEREGLSERLSAQQTRPVMQDMINQWWRDVNGQKQPTERKVDELLDKTRPVYAALGSGAAAFAMAGGLSGNPLVGALVGSYVGYRFYRGISQGGDFKTRAITGAMLEDMAHLKLGAFLNLFSPFVNLSQTLIGTMPVLGAKYTGIGLRRYGRALKDWTTGRHNLDIRLLERAGINTQHTGADINPALFKEPPRWKFWSLFFFNQAEQMNRGVMFLGALAKAEDEGMTPGAAKREAERAVTRVHFDYSNVNKPEILRNVFLRVPGQFKNFFAQELAFIFGMNRQELTRFAIGVFLIAGVIGLPFLDLLDTLLDELLGIGSPMNEVKHFIIQREADGGMAGLLTTFLARGFPALLGADMSARAGFEQFFPTELRDFKGPWWTTIETAAEFGRANATLVDQIRNLSAGLGAPLKALEALGGGYPLVESILAGKWGSRPPTLTSPWLRNRIEYEPTGGELLLKALGGTPLRETQLRDLRKWAQYEDRQLGKGSVENVDAYVAALKAHDFDETRAIVMRAAEEGNPLTLRQIKEGLRNADLDRIERLIRSSRKQLRPEIYRLYQGIAAGGGEEE